MKKYLSIFISFTVFLFACNPDHDHDDHAHEHEEEGLSPLAYTLYTKHSELFVEFKPLVVGKESGFAAHLTKLGDTFLPVNEGSVSVSLDVNGSKIRNSIDSASSPGIFRLALTPDESGKGNLTFFIRTKEYDDTIVISDLTVYADEKSAMEEQQEESPSGDISYLKEQQWKVEFANMEVKRQPFYDVIKTSGQLLSSPGDEMFVTANATGIVVFSGTKAIAGEEVSSGENLFSIQSGDLTENNLDASFKEAKSNLDKAKADFDRAAELVKDQIISQKEFQDIKLKYETAQTAFNVFSKNYSAGGMKVNAPMSGYLKNILITEGQYVEAGQLLATVSKNKKLILKAEVSQKYFPKLASITSATFRTDNSEKIYSTDELNGRLISFGKSADAHSPFLPVTFEINNQGDFVPGSFAEIFLKSGAIENALVIPVSALMEEQGNFYVYVQTEGETVQKRDVMIGATDGKSVQILSGIEEGERVVVKGAYQIKLSSMSGTMPAHGHEH